MRSIGLLSGVLAATVSCVEAPARVPQAARLLRSACNAMSATAGSQGIEVRTGRFQTDAHTVFVTNTSDATRVVEITQVSRVEGSCAADWAQQTPLRFTDEKTCQKPGDMTLSPGESIEVRIGDQRVQGKWSCTKVGIAVFLKVDGAPVCGDAGAWVAAGEHDVTE